ncbi:MAG: hypothetical protein ACRDDX_14975 [Cellulosilyticaceae bacterium]
MTQSDQLEKVYIQNLENNIIKYLAEKLKIGNRQAMDIYYKSKLCEQIHQGLYGIQYMDYKYLAEDLIENELNKII